MHQSCFVKGQDLGFSTLIRRIKCPIGHANPRVVYFFFLSENQISTFKKIMLMINFPQWVFKIVEWKCRMLYTLISHIHFLLKMNCRDLLSSFWHTGCCKSDSWMPGMLERFTECKIWNYLQLQLVVNIDLNHWLIDWSMFYAISAVCQSYKDEKLYGL